MPVTERKFWGGRTVLGPGIVLPAWLSLLHSPAANQGTQKGFPAALCSPRGVILWSAYVAVCSSISFKQCLRWPGRLFGGAGLLMAFCLVYLRVSFVYFGGFFLSFFVSQRKQLGKNFGERQFI